MTGAAAESFFDDVVTLHTGDMLAVLPSLPADSFDSGVTDPPYHLQSIVKRFQKTGGADRARTTSGPHQRTAAGFMNQSWDGGDIAFRADTWREVFRVLKPGAYLLAFGGTRTYHRIACAIEDAGFVIYDMIAWAYGQGFPKSKNVALAFEATLCERRSDDEWIYLDSGEPMRREPPFRCAEADAWWGWGTLLKPAFEPIALVRKPIAGTTIENLVHWGTGALNIDACRIAGPMDGVWGTSNATCKPTFNQSPGQHDYRTAPHDDGRFPANIIHDGSAEVMAVFPDDAGAFAPVRGSEPSAVTDHVYGDRGRVAGAFHDDSGSAARFFYTAKADADDRLGSRHPTVKPLDLIRYLVRLVTPRGGRVLDPFAGTGTTGEAAWHEGMRATLIEREPAYCTDIRRRMALVRASDRERAHESIKAAGKEKPPGPLFEGLGEAAE